MRISTKGVYAIRMLIDLAQHKNDGYIALKDIAQRQNISKKYLEQIVSTLNKSHILQTNRGFQGGYRLAVSPECCSVGRVLKLTEGSLSPVPETMGSYSIYDDPCYFVWQGLKNVIDEYLESITIQDIVDQLTEIYANYYVI
ncbi:MAG: Rrf2 family transcriptional regulator [Ruminococcus sp.]|nr:Rrf2 family transcriptional regulator [Ruminococcus sp.]